MGSLSVSKRLPSRIEIRPVMSPEEAPELARVLDEALRPDSYHEFLTRFSPATPYQAALNSFTTSIEDKERGQVFKAVAVIMDAAGKIVEERAVGVSQWYIGHVESLPADQSQGWKTGIQDPARDAVPPENPVTPPERRQIGRKGEQNKGSEFSYGDEFVKQISETYVTNMKDKKHIFLRRMAVLPAFQKRGIATKFLQIGIDRADDNDLFGWLNARPAGYQLYKKAGWENVRIIEISVPGLEVAPIVAMLRRPQRREVQPAG